MNKRWKILVTKSFKNEIKTSFVKKISSKILSELEKELILDNFDTLSILLCDNLKIHELNLEYRNKNKPTDVLSFPSIEGFNFIENTSLGDLAISLEKAKFQAPKFSNTYENEIIRLLTHGILHLCGFDHEGVSKSEAEKMRRLERKIFNIVKL